MIEALFEFSLSIIDYSYLLFFYLLLINKKWEWKSAIIWILVVVSVQYIKDTSIYFSSFSSSIDDVLVVLFLFSYGRQCLIRNFLYAVMVNVIFSFVVTFLVSCALEVGIDISATLVFGWNRFLFASVLKICTILLLLIICKPLKEMQVVMQDSAEYLMVFIMCSITFTFSYVYGNFQSTDTIFMYCLFLSIILIAFLYLFYYYCRLVKRQMDQRIIQYSINTTIKHTKKLEEEHESIRKIRHDIQNQLSILSLLISDKKYEEADNFLKQTIDYVDTNKVSISGNLFVDAILQQKMGQYPDIKFNLDVHITKDFKMDEKDIVSLLMNIIDNACEELLRIEQSSFSLKLVGNQSQLVIEERNTCQKDNELITRKDKKLHGYGLKIIEEIVKKYQGEMNLTKSEGTFIISIILPF